MTETPVILSHNVLKNAFFNGDHREGFKPLRMSDGLRWTWWEGVSASEHFIYVAVPTMLANGDLNTNVDGWYVHESGGADGTFTHNTTDPIDGDGDGFIDAVTADNSDKVLAVMSLRGYYLEAGRTYRFGSVAAADASRGFRCGFVDADLDEACGSDFTVGTDVEEMYVDFTPSSSGEYRVFWRPTEAGDFHVDDAHLCEVRDVDSFFIDRGHSLFGYYFTVKYADTIYSQAQFNTWQSGELILSDNPLYRSYGTGKRGVQWRLGFTPTAIPGIVPPQVNLLWLGRRWKLPRNFSGSFDPRASRVYSDTVVGERGIESASKQYSRRLFKGVLRNISPDEYSEVEMFMDDTDDGALPFGFVYRPDSDPFDATVIRLEKGGCETPYRGGYLREWNFNAAELSGYRNI